MIDTTLIFSDDQYKQYCKSVSNYSSQWEDLYQEFAVILLTGRHQANNIEAYCKGIIYKTWRNMTGGTHGKASESMLLANYADRAVQILEDKYSNSSHSEYNHSGFNSIMLAETIPADHSEVLDEFSKLLNSTGRIRVKAEITQEFINGTNRLKISKARSINYRTAHDAVSDTIETIKQNMNKADIKAALLAQGIQASYSGKDKTFYTSKQVSKELEAKIISSGFKQAKR